MSTTPRTIGLPVEVASPGAADEAPSLPIAETFMSLQGEGRLAGVPSFFIRVAGCNLRCAWCDTPYTSWAPEGERRTVALLVDEVKASRTRHVVVTGGEPMLFAPVAGMVKELRNLGLHVTIETAGTVDNGASCDLLSVSPKLSNSLPEKGDPRDPDGSWRQRHAERRLNPKVLQAMWDRHRARQLKFVVRDEGDLVDIEDFLGRLAGWRKDDVMLMPEGVTPPSDERKAWIVRACVERGWRYCQRLHIDLFGHTRGT